MNPRLWREGGTIVAAIAATWGLQGPQALRPDVTREEIAAHVRTLASDELAGRKTGTKEAVAAAEYMAGVLQRSGVEPAGDDGSFLQAVPIVRTRFTGVPELTLHARAEKGDPERIEAVNGQDFRAPDSALDLHGVRVIVARAAGDVPKQAEPGAAIFLDATEREAERWLSEAGHSSADAFALRITAGGDTPGNARRATERGETLALGPAKGRSSLRLRGPLLALMRRGEIESLSLKTSVESETVAAYNVVGRVRGTGELAEEAVVVSAHYDHLGTREPAADPRPSGEAEDRIFNGADDDASGCAAVLEIAGALAAHPKAARTTIFLLATGEEVGLLGTRYYLDHPAVPLEKTVANINVEMIGRPDALAGGAGKLWLTGYERSNLGPACAKAGLPVVADARPDQHFFERSDNIAFVMRGVVGQTFSSYDLHEDYHTVEDEADKIDFAHMESCVRAVLGAVLLVVDGELRPSWIEGREPSRR